ncbi:hypothetical protein [Photobacterium leiognathi]|uniref:hypothetical protein n=1 Tax=Photobacterium leiognathi TaxID=553611 RepID=UPI002981BA21|nr:hypothetical protein [Photobacterium leiognathi]
MKSEFEYLETMLEEFLNKDYVIERLYVIDSMDITGWEIWFQIEFSFFLANHESEPEWYREYLFAIDARKDKLRSYAKPDFLIRKKGWARDRYAALEVKLHPSATSCVSNVLADFDKVRKIRNSEIDLRSYWGLGFCRERDLAAVESIIDDKSYEKGYDLSPNYRVVRNIHDTAFSYFII